MPTPAELFHHCPRCGAAHPGPAGQVPFECPACNLTLFFNPTVAAGVFLFDGDGRALLIRRAKEPAKGKFAVPGGFIDPGETAEDGLRREVREEVGLEVERLAFVCSFPNLYEYRGVSYPVVDLMFTATAIDPQTAQPLDAVAGLEWVRLPDVNPADLAFPSIRKGWELLTRVGHSLRE